MIMKYLLPLLLCLPLATACKSVPLSEVQQQTVEALEAERVMAVDAGNTELVDDIDAAIAEIEGEAVTGLVDAVRNVVAPLLPAGGPIALAIAAGIPLLFKRPRDNFAKAIKALNPNNTDVPASQAIHSIMAMYGLKHTDEAT